MSRPVNKRVSLPGASELFRTTQAAPEVAPKPKPVAVTPPAGSASGRVKHDHKITVYFSEDELLALEDANLELRRAHGIRVDRGRIVRVAVAHALAELSEHGAKSFLVNEFRQT